jgi:hypothetical protein
MYLLFIEAIFLKNNSNIYMLKNRKTLKRKFISRRKPKSIRKSKSRRKRKGGTGYLINKNPRVSPSSPFNQAHAELENNKNQRGRDLNSSRGRLVRSLSSPSILSREKISCCKELFHCQEENDMLKKELSKQQLENAEEESKYYNDNKKIIQLLLKVFDRDENVSQEALNKLYKIVVNSNENKKNNGPFAY